MVNQKNGFAFSRKIKLAPAIGDWTTIQYRDSDMEEINISPIRNINFDSMPRDQLKYVHYLHYRLAEKITKKLSQDMDIKVELHSIVASQMAYDDFLNAQQNSVVQTDFVLGEHGRVNVLFEWALADMIVNRLVGGKGEESDAETFSDLEGEILKTQTEELVPYFIDAWKSIFTQDQLRLDFQCGKYMQDKKVTLREAYIIFTFYFYFGQGDLRKVTWAYPNHILRKLLTIRQTFSDPIKKRIAIYPNTLSKTKIPIKAVLGETTLRMQDIKNLQVGDVITLDTYLDEPLKIYVGGQKTRLSGQPGVVDHKVCIQLLMLEDQGSPYKRTIRNTVLPFIQETPFVEPLSEQPAPVYNAPAIPAEEETMPAPIPTPVIEEEVETDDWENEPDDVEEESPEEEPGEEEVADDEWGDLDDDEETPEEPETTLADVTNEPLSEPAESPEGEETEEEWDDDFSWDDLDAK